MILASMLLVIVGFVLLVLGVLEVGGQPLTLVYASIGACLVAALLLVVGVLRGRPSRRSSPPAATGADASWAGATAWSEDRGHELSEAIPAPAPWATASEAEEAEVQRLDALLADVPGLAAEQRHAVRDRYGSITALRSASREDLVGIEGISEETAERIMDALA